MNNYQPNFMNQPYGMYGINGINPMQSQMQPQPQRFQTPDQQYVQQMQTQPIQQAYKPSGLQGKIVDSIDVVKATDIPLDGSISYFAISDGSAIVTKQLQTDGTSKITIYKPTENNEEDKITAVGLTEEQVTKLIEKNENKTILELRNDIKNIKRQIEDLKDDVEEKSKSKK